MTAYGLEIVLVCSSKNLVFLAVPKAASTSIEAVLEGVADQNVPKKQFPKHIPARAFYQRWKSFSPPGASRPDAFAVIRHPIDRLCSWYRYRQRPEIVGSANSTTNLTFEEFVNEYLREDRKPFADIGNQYRFCTDAHGRHLVRYLFSYNKLSLLEQFIHAKFEIGGKLPHLNMSRLEPQALSRRTISRLEKSNTSEFEFYESVNASGRNEFETVFSY